MKNIRIKNDSKFLATSIPEECIPKRFAFATNILLCSDIKNGQKGFLVFNYEPEKWNQWYPFFSSVNDMYNFNVKTYDDMVKVLKNEIMLRKDVQSRMKKAELSFLDLIGIDGEIKFKESPVGSEMWLKYSKTQDIWTLYYIEFVQVYQIKNINFESLNSNTIDFIPLTEYNIKEIISTGKFKGIDVVDNTIDILKNKEIISELILHSI